SLRYAKELNQLDRIGEALELLEEGFQLANLLEEDFPSLKRKQSHIRKQHSQGSSKESQQIETKTVKRTSYEKRTARTQTSIYVTKAKDTLSRIAKKYLGNQVYWKKIYKLNPNIQNPNLIYPKQKIQLPQK
ncbi:MAG: LysM peptidoglycan-binding domain-containing protein, partial [Leptospiraceae bacterium]|nr:LysM peptidoglycan-binding domain-containing protein [Leptospiraceae bacterium]